MATYPYLRPMYPWPAPEIEFTAADLLDLPSDGHTYEILDGGLHVTPPADIAHHRTADEVLVALRASAPPGWWAVRCAGIQIGDSTVVPDLTVLRPGAPVDTVWAQPGDVALVVEVESTASRRLDRFGKPSLYAEAEIESFWRIERTEAGPVAHLYHGAARGHYAQHRSVNPGESVVTELPYQVQVAPATWVS